MILTLSYIKEEAEKIASHWNGSDESFVGGDGEVYSDDDAETALELLTKIEEIEMLVEALNINT